ncbi:MAG: hypothetical protein H6703_17415 [Myxococcales bacterium]|nr:hypothetical protein [Myxococcales bacterium]
MGLLRWLFPGPAEKVAKARRLMAEGRFAEARLLVVDVDDEAARALVAEAEAALVRVNLEGALQRCRAGDEAAVAGHLEVARRFARGEGEAAFAEVEAAMAAVRRRRALDGVWQGLRAAADRRRRLGDDPGDFVLGALSGSGAVRLFFGGEEPFGLPGIELGPRASDFVPGWVPAVADPGQPSVSERAAVADALRAAWPEALHGAVAAAGDALVEAMVALGAGRPERAVARLLDLPAENAAARFELGRAAAALGQHEAAAVALGEARAAAGAAFVVGGLSSRVLEAQVLRWAGAAGAAWSVVGEMSAAERGAAAHLCVALAMETGRLDEAEAALSALAAGDPGRPQLEAALALRRALAAEVAAAPILVDRARVGSAAYRAAAEAAAGRLQQEVDRVLAALRAVEAASGGEEAEEE